MNYDKVKKDYKKRYGSECERIYFMGKPLTFFRGNEGVIGCGVSVGCFIATEKRDDERICVQFGHSDRFITVNATELEKSNDNKIFDSLLKLKRIGVKVGGVRLFISKNAKLKTPDIELMLSSAEAFCENLPRQNEILSYFGFNDNRISVADFKENYLSYIAGSKNEYIPLRRDLYKIVLCYVRDRGVENYFIAEADVSGACDLLKNGDVENFGKLLSINTERLIEKNRLKATGNLYKTASGYKDCIGCGLLEEGGIFFIAENKNVDYLIRSISLEYKNHFGAPPEFYVTDTETSGRIF